MFVLQGRGIVPLGERVYDRRRSCSPIRLELAGEGGGGGRPERVEPGYAYELLAVRR